MKLWLTQPRFQGPVRVVVSCVEEKAPYRTHPHKVVGKKCNQGVCIADVDESNMTLTLQSLGIQCVKKKDMAESLTVRRSIGIDPFKQGYDHMHQGSPSMNLNAIRLSFQCYLMNLPGNRQHIALTPIVSDVIKDKKAYNDLTIVDYSDNWSPVTGGKKILLFTKKVSKSDIQVHFSYVEPNTQKRLVLRGSFTPYNVHEQYAISLTTPPFVDQKIKTRVQVSMANIIFLLVYTPPLIIHFGRAVNA